MGGGGDFGSGSGSKFNCAARVGSGRVRRSRVRAGFGLQFWARADLYKWLRTKKIILGWSNPLKAAPSSTTEEKYHKDLEWYEGEYIFTKFTFIPFTYLGSNHDVILKRVTFL